jgi:hypothetical protein
MVSKTVVRLRFGVWMPQTASVVHPVSPEFQITFRTDEPTHAGLLEDMLSWEKSNSSTTAAQ